MHLLGRVPPPELPRYLAAAEVVWMPSLPSVQYAKPNVETKIYEGMAVGLAVLTSDLAGRRRVRRPRAGCGIAVPPTVDGHVDGVRRLLARPRRGARAWANAASTAVRERYSWEAAEGELVAFYAELCRGLAND